MDLGTSSNMLTGHFSVTGWYGKSYLSIEVGLPADVMFFSFLAASEALEKHIDAENHGEAEKKAVTQTLRQNTKDLVMAEGETSIFN